MNDPVYARRLELRRLALAEGVEVIAWSHDPLDAVDAQLSVSRLGAIVERYVPDEDRLLAEWWIRRPHVERRLSPPAGLPMRSGDAAAAPAMTPGAQLPDVTAPRFWVPIGTETGRGDLRELLESAFARGYRIVEFEIDAPRTGGRYLLARK